jgi:hypothetical protein
MIMILLAILSAMGSLASIAGLLVSLYVLRKEKVIEEDVTMLKYEEEAWHEKEG